MLTPEDRRAIEGLFDRLSAVEDKAPPRDAEAEELIRRSVAAQPGAPYYMAQTILVQESALNQAEQRIAELEAQVRERRQGGGLFGGLFGGGAEDADRRDYRRERPPADPRYDERGQGGPWSRPQGGFLAGAAQTALGVTGGVLLGSAIAGMLGGGGAQASELQPVEPAADDPGAGDGDGGGDFGDFGGGDFDIGGDF